MTTEPTRRAVPRVAIYARQSVEEDLGIAQQIADCEEEIRRRGWLAAGDPYPDNDVSGSTTRGAKTNWAKMLKAFDSGEFDVLMVTEVDRLTRSLTDVLDIRPRYLLSSPTIRQDRKGSLA